MRTSRVDHVGSLLRPEALKQAFLRHAAGQADAGALSAAQDEAIRAVIAAQERHGLPVVTDGEFRRLNWQVSFSEVEGWDLWAGSWRNFLQSPENRGPHERPLSKGDDAVVSFRAPATARLRLVRSFPMNLFAGFFGFEPAIQYPVAEADKATPNVDFSDVRSGGEAAPATPAPAGGTAK